MRINRLCLGLAVLSLLAGCALQAGKTPSASPALLSLDAEAAAILARIYQPEPLARSLAVYGLQREAVEAEVLSSCSIAYSIVARTENRPKERRRQLQELHGSPYYLAEENRCAESLIAGKVQASQWQRITAGQLQAGELLHLGRFDVALTQFNDWAEQACPAKQAYVTTVFQALKQRIVRQQTDMQLLADHYREPQRLARVLSWHSGRRSEDYAVNLQRAEMFAQRCSAESLPNYRGISFE